MRTRILVALICAFSIAACSGGGGSGSATPPSSSSAVSQAGAAIGNAQYRVTELPTFGGVLGNAASINARESIVGAADPAGDVVSHAALWIDGKAKDLGTLGGPNSAVSWPNLNDFGIISGISETAAMNTYHEPWGCTGFFLPVVTPTGHVCVAFRWQNNAMTALPTLGGQNGYGAGNNNEGQIVGWAETTVHDSTCTNGQVLQFEPVLWDASNHAHRFPTLPGDPDGAATAVNDIGEAVGISGICDQAVGRFTAKHPVIWHNGRVSQLFDPGSKSWNTPQAISERGDVTGFINLPGPGDDAGQLQPIAFVWTPQRGLTKIPPLPGDAYSFGNGINDEGDVVGNSYGPNFSTVRAFIYHNGKAVDLNSLVPAGTPELVFANSIDDYGTIVGEAATSTGALGPAFTARLSIGCNLDSAFAAAMKTQTMHKPLGLSIQTRQQLLRKYGIR